MRRRTLLTTSAAGLAALTLAACGGDTKSKDTPSEAPLVETEPELTEEATPRPVPSSTMEPPTVEVPAGEPPTELKITDLVEGDGEEAVTGMWVLVHYTGVAWSTGKEFDSSWKRGEPFPFPLGGGQVIQGWEEGIEGMKVGGRRQLIIPPDKGYGDAGAGSDIKPGETLIFVCDLIDVAK